VTTVRAGRRAVLRLGALTALFLLAGMLPWLTAGPLPTRLIALPLLLAGALMAVATARLRTSPLPHRRTAAARPATCAACSCSTAGVCEAAPAGAGSRPDTVDE
jgi:hypothetical protein